MTNLLEITDGTLTVPLIGSSGFRAQAGGLGPRRLTAAQIFGEGPDLGGSLIEGWKVHLQETTQDLAAASLQNLLSLLRKARQLEETSWQRSPVWLRERTRTEANIRYARVRGLAEIEIPDPFESPFDFDTLLASIAIPIEREHPWRGASPDALPSAIVQTKTDGSVDKNRIHVPSIWHTQAASHLFNFDASLAAFSTNQITANGITFWSVSGATPAAGDIFYIGFATRPGFHFVIPIITAGNFSADVVPEYGKGGGAPVWTALTIGSQFLFFDPLGGQTSEDGLLKSIGEWVLAWAPPTDWALATINGISAYWIRLRLNTVTSWTTTPVSHSTEDCYTPRKSYFEISSSVLPGDAPPRLLVRAFAPYGGGTTPGPGALSRILIGAKSRAVSTFTAQLHLHNFGLPANWARTLGTDTTEEDDVRAPEGKRSLVSFATDATMISRVRLVGTGLLDDYAGAGGGALYGVYVILEQTGGAVGDLKVKLRTLIGGSAVGLPTFDLPGAGISPKAVDLGYEALYLGLLNLPFGPTVAADSLGTDIAFELQAQRISGAAQLRLSRIVLMPLDEWYFEADDPAHDVTNGASALRGNTALDIDFDVLDVRTLKYVRNGGVLYPSEIWHRTTGPSRIEPAKQYRFCALLLYYASTFGSEPFLVSSASFLSIEVYGVSSFQLLRGAA